MRIILSADDYGRSAARNEAIDLAFSQGLIQSAALMVATPFSQDAVNKAFDNISGGVHKLHCHLNVVGGAIGGFQKPLTKTILQDSYLCDGKNFREIYGRLRGWTGIKRVLTFIPILKELNAQYKEFKRITKGIGNMTHVDFHLYQNLNFPIAIAMRIFTLLHGIKSARFIGEHLKNGRQNRLLYILNKSIFVKTYPSCNIDYYLMNQDRFAEYDTIELYVHPDMVDGAICDNSISIYGNEKRKLIDNI